MFRNHPLQHRVQILARLDAEGGCKVSLLHRGSAVCAQPAALHVHMLTAAHVTAHGCAFLLTQIHRLLARRAHKLRQRDGRFGNVHHLQRGLVGEHQRHQLAGDGAHPRSNGTLILAGEQPSRLLDRVAVLLLKRLLVIRVQGREAPVLTAHIEILREGLDQHQRAAKVRVLLHTPRASH